MHLFLSDVYDALMKAILSCPEYPMNVPLHICETDCRESSMSIVLRLDDTKTTICGGEINTYNVDLFYRVIAQTDAKKINVFNILEKISNYLKENYSKFNLNNFKILSKSSLMGKEESGLDIFLSKFKVEVS